MFQKCGGYLHSVHDAEGSGLTASSGGHVCRQSHVEKEGQGNATKDKHVGPDAVTERLNVQTSCETTEAKGNRHVT